LTIYVNNDIISKKGEEDMEKVVMTIGFAIFFFSFNALIVINNAWAWGCLIGIILVAIGNYFSEE